MVKEPHNYENEAWAIIEHLSSPSHTGELTKHYREYICRTLRAIMKRELQQPVNCREAFERWNTKDREFDNFYDSLWEAWQAAWRPEREIGEQLPHMIKGGDRLWHDGKWWRPE